MNVALRCDAERMLAGLRVVQAHSQHAFRPLLPAEMASCFTQRGRAGPESGFWKVSALHSAAELQNGMMAQ